MDASAQTGSHELTIPNDVSSKDHLIHCFVDSFAAVATRQVLSSSGRHVMSILPGARFGFDYIAGLLVSQIRL